MISRPEIQAFLGTYQEGAEKFPVHLQLHPGVDPSSIFLTGSSGSGKSTAGQCMAIQFAKQRTPLLALDLGHTLSPDHICPPLSSEFEALAIRHDLYNEPVATDILNPKPCGSNTESPYDTAYGLCQIIGQNNRFGPAQIASLTAEVKTIVERREICPHIFPSILKALKSSTSANVRMLGNRLEPLLQHDVFERRQNGSSSLPISPHIHIFDVSSYPDTIRTTLAELLLYDWFRSARALQIPIVIMVDEVQNLRLGRGTVLNRIITEGRKFSIGSILISQSLKGFAPDEQLALSQTGTKLFFKPPLTEIRACSEMLAEPVRRSGTVELLKKLKVGQCLLLSDFTYIGDSLQPSSVFLGKEPPSPLLFLNKQVGGFIMNIPDGFFKTLFLPSTLICFQLWARHLYFTTPPCCHSGDCGYIDCSAITLRDQSLFFNCGYVSPPLNAQYEVVQPDLHSLERYDFSKMPDLPWYP